MKKRSTMSSISKKKVCLGNGVSVSSDDLPTAVDDEETKKRKQEELAARVSYSTQADLDRMFNKTQAFFQSLMVEQQQIHIC